MEKKISNRCKHVYKRGRFEGQTCGALLVSANGNQDYCTKHRKRSPPRSTIMPYFPNAQDVDDIVYGTYDEDCHITQVCECETCTGGGSAYDDQYDNANDYNYDDNDDDDFDQWCIENGIN